MIRDLIGAVVGTQTSVTCKQIVQSLDYVRFNCAGRQGESNIIERAFHVKGWTKRFTTHPEHTRPPVVGKHLSDSDLVNVLRRERDADDLQLLPFAVYDCRQSTSWL